MLSNMRISKKITMGFVFVILLTMISGVVSFISLSNISALLDSFYKHSYTVSVNVLEMERDVMDISRYMKDIASFQTTGQIKEAQEKVNDLEQNIYNNIDIVKERFLGDQGIVIEIEKKFNSWKPIRDEVIEFSLVGQSEKAAEITRSNGAPLINKISGDIENIRELAEVEANQFIVDADAASQQAIIIIIGIFVVVFVLAIILAVIIVSNITKSLKKIQFEVETLAEHGGDLTLEVGIQTKDEIGDLSKGINNFIVGLRQIINQVKDISVQVASTSEELSASAEQSNAANEEIAASIQQVASGAEEQSKRIHEGVASINEMVINVHQIAANADRVAIVADQTLQKSKDGNEGVSIVVQKMGLISSAVNELAGSIKILGEYSDNIGSITELISDVSSQTDLLALNAAIEAARAGEHGRGFAVVADEVRKLAEQSATSTQKIATLITSVQKETQHALTSMELTGIEVLEGDKLIKSLGGNFKEIIDYISNVTHQSNEISNATLLLESLSEQVKTFIETAELVSNDTAASSQNVAASTEEQLAATEEIASTSVSLAKMSEELQMIVDRFIV